MGNPISTGSWVRRSGSTAAMLVLAALLLPSAWLAAPPAARAETCTWGQPGYRDCVEDLIAKSKSESAGAGKTLDPQQSLQETNRKTAPQQAAKSRKSGRRPGAGSLTPVPPVPFDVTPPRYGAAGQAIAAERRQRQLDDNLFRLQRQTPVQPILPPVVNPPMPGQICPSWGC